MPTELAVVGGDFGGAKIQREDVLADPESIYASRMGRIALAALLLIGCSDAGFSNGQEVRCDEASYLMRVADGPCPVRLGDGATGQCGPIVLDPGTHMNGCVGTFPPDFACRWYFCESADAR